MLITVNAIVTACYRDLIEILDDSLTSEAEGSYSDSKSYTIRDNM